MNKITLGGFTQILTRDRKKKRGQKQRYPAALLKIYLTCIINRHRGIELLTLAYTTRRNKTKKGKGWALLYWDNFESSFLN